MNREINFRAWLPELKLMVDSVTVGYGAIGFPAIDFPELEEALRKTYPEEYDGEDELVIPHWIYEHEDFFSVDDERKFVLLQFTGLKDKNGKEIYEGDIVEAIMNHHGKESSIKFNAKVVYNSHTGAFQISYLNTSNHFVNDTIYSRYFLKVIGNIFQNPDLIENGGPQ